MENKMLIKKIQTKNNQSTKPLSSIDRSALLKMEQAELRLAKKPSLELLRTDYLE